MLHTEISLCSQALIRLGANAITAFDEGTAEADIADALYPSIRDFLLSSYAWSFAMTSRTLARRNDVAQGGPQHRFQLPVDTLRVMDLSHADARGWARPLEYRIEGDMVLVAADAVRLTYIAKTDVSLYPPYFVKALVDRLSAEFCLPVTENTARSELLNRLAQTSFQLARTADAQGETPNAIEDFSLLNARY